MDRRTTLPLADLIEDLTIYPRHRVDEYHVQALADALRAGAILPPVLVDATSKRIVDGWHRVRAYRKVIGETGVIDVILRTYTSEADLIADAVRLNARHGRRLTVTDQVRAIRLLEQAGVAPRQISVILELPEEKVEKLRVRIAYTPVRHEPIPLKRPVLHLREQTLTPAQVEVHEQLPGVSFLYQARTLRKALEADMVNEEDERLIEELQALEQAIAAWFARHAVAVA